MIRTRIQTLLLFLNTGSPAEAIEARAVDGAEATARPESFVLKAAAESATASAAQMSEEGEEEDSETTVMETVGSNNDSNDANDRANGESSNGDKSGVGGGDVPSSSAAGLPEKTLETAGSKMMGSSHTKGNSSSSSHNNGISSSGAERDDVNSNGTERDNVNSNDAKRGTVNSNNDNSNIKHKNNDNNSNVDSPGATDAASGVAAAAATAPAGATAAAAVAATLQAKKELTDPYHDELTTIPMPSPNSSATQPLYPAPKKTPRIGGQIPHDYTGSISNPARPRHPQHTSIIDPGRVRGRGRGRGGRGRRGRGRGRGGGLFAEAAAFLGVAPGEVVRMEASSDEEGVGRRESGAGAGGGKRRRTGAVTSGASVASGSVQMGFDGGCYLSAHVRGKRFGLCFGCFW